MGIYTHTDFLNALTHAPADAVKTLADGLLDSLGAIRVIVCRTGLVMLPTTDSAHGTRYHLGEVAAAEAHVALDDHGVEGYALVSGRDREQALAIALLDAARAAGIAEAPIAAFITDQIAAQAAADAALLAQVEATRIEMETF